LSGGGNPDSLRHSLHDAGRSNRLLCVSAPPPPAVRVASAMEYGVDAL